MSEPFSIKKECTLPKITGTFTAKDSDGNTIPVDITGATVAFRMKNVDTDELKIDDAAAIIDDPENGLVSYEFLSTDTDVVGRYLCEWVITQSGDVEILPTRSCGVVYVEETL